MHIHGSVSNVQGASFASILGGERAAAAQRAADVRKRLLKNAQTLDGDTTPEETLLIGQWLDSRHSQMLGGDEYQLRPRARTLTSVEAPAGSDGELPGQP